MRSYINRRDFVRGSLQAGALASVGDLAFLRALPALSAADVQMPPGKVQFGPDIEPLVRLIEDTPRTKLLEEVAGRIKTGLSYQQLLAALMLAGARGMKGDPLGGQFDADRWLPLFWSLDNFKVRQPSFLKKGWVMPVLPDAQLPPAHQAKERFIQAMDDWDADAADRALTALVRSAGAMEVMEIFWRLGSRDYRSIGHKSIYTANAWRTLQTIGWRHAEPVLRSLTISLLYHDADNPARLDLEADRPGRDNLKRLTKIRTGWQQGKRDEAAAPALLSTIRTGTPAEASELVVELLNKDVAPAVLWDGIFLGAGEVMMRRPNVVGLHCETMANAMHYAYQASGDDATRRYIMLQAAAFLPMLRVELQRRFGLAPVVRIDTLEKAELKSTGAAAIEEILTDVTKDRLLAARKTLAFLDNNGPQADALMAAVRRLIFLKSREEHDYKFSSAALEDFYHATPAWRNRFLATGMYVLHGTQETDNDVVKRTRAALA
jgi:hypothetical protein